MTYLKNYPNNTILTLLSILTYFSKYCIAGDFDLKQSLWSR